MTANDPKRTLRPDVLTHHYGETNAQGVLGAFRLIDNCLTRAAIDCDALAGDHVSKG